MIIGVHRRLNINRRLTPMPADHPESTIRQANWGSWGYGHAAGILWCNSP
jgi:hypothetical protein